MRDKRFIIQGDIEYGPVSLRNIVESKWFGKKDMVLIKGLDIGEILDLDICPACKRGKGERVVIRVI